MQLIFETNILAKLEEGRLFNALSCGLFLTYNIKLIKMHCKRKKGCVGVLLIFSFMYKINPGVALPPPPLVTSGHVAELRNIYSCHHLPFSPEGNVDASATVLEEPWTYQNHYSQTKLLP